MNKGRLMAKGKPKCTAVALGSTYERKQLGCKEEDDGRVLPGIYGEDPVRMRGEGVCRAAGMLALDTRPPFSLNPTSFFFLFHWEQVR